MVFRTLKSTIFVLHAASIGGAQKAAISTALNLYRNGWDIQMLTINHKDKHHFGIDAMPWNDLNGPQSDDHWPWRIINPVKFIIRTLRLRQFLKNKSPDYVVSFLTTTNLMTLIASYSSQWNVIVSERSDPKLQVLRFPYKYLRKYLYKRAHVVTANTQAALDAMSGWVPDSKLVLIPNSINIKQCRKKYDVRNILSVGRLHYDKGHDVLIKAISILKQRANESRVTIIGDGHKKSDYEVLVDKLDLNNEVWLAGSREDVDQYYMQASIFILPSRLEGMPNALLEAMSFGLVCIVTDASPGPLTLIEDKVNGLVVNAGNAESLANAIEYIFNNPDEARKYGTSARQFVASHYSEEKTIAKWECLLNN